MSIKDTLEESRKALIAERDALASEPIADFDETKQARAKEIRSQVAELDARLADLADEEQRSAAAAEVRAKVEVKAEPNPVYRKDGKESYFRDLANATKGDRDASRRLADSQERAITTTAGDGGEFAPPLWIVDEFIELNRAARVAADLVDTMPLPSGVSSVSVPKVATGTAVGIVQTQATDVTNTDLTTTSVSSDITTISGGQTVSIQLLKQSAVPIDSIVLKDLALAYASSLDQQVLNGTGANGQLAGLTTSGTTVTYTTTAPAVVSSTAAASFYGKVMGAVSATTSSRLLPPDAIVMHPRRWAWVLNALDSSARPLVVPNGSSFNPVGTGGAAAQGPAGTLAGLPVYLDANIPTNLGAATNQDQVFVLRRGDHMLWETPVEASSFEATYAPSNAVYFRVNGFAAFITRYAASSQVISGTGLVAPSF